MQTLSLLPAVESAGLVETARFQNVHLAGDSTADVADGINAMPATYELVANLSPAGMDVIVGFLRDHVGLTFLWLAPRETTPRQWQAKSWTRVFIGPEQDRITISLEQRFNP